MLGVFKPKTSVHNPKTNKLTYLSAYSFQTAYDMLRNDSWTKAIFFRAPVKRFVSGYYDKIQRTTPEIDLATFVSKLEHGWHHNMEVHWKSQCEYVHKCDAILPFINFIGDFDNLANDTRRLLERVGAWEEYGRTGWGDDGGKCIFCRGVRAAGGHATNSTSRSQGILASQPDLVRRIKLLVSEDVRIIPRYIRT
ncbi:fucosyltransferase [Pseudoscourfieldia marina]